MGLCLKLGLTLSCVGRKRRRTREARGARGMLALKQKSESKRSSGIFDRRTRRCGIAHSYLVGIHTVSVKDSTSILMHRHEATRKSKERGLSRRSV